MVAISTVDSVIYDWWRDVYLFDTEHFVFAVKVLKYLDGHHTK